MKVEWRVGQAWEGRWQGEYLLAANSAVVDYRRVGAIANITVIHAAYRICQKGTTRNLELGQKS
jgi:hypothetical protein